MLAKLSEIEVPEEEPFRNDVLNRKSVASHLTSLLTEIEDSFVFSLSSAYGTGKTVFVRMWKQKLENEGFVTLYYNAWENDFVDDPLIAFIEEITDRINEIDATSGGEWRERINALQSIANKVAWRTIPVGLKLLTAGAIQAEDFDERVLTEVVEGVGSEAIEQYRSTKEDMEEFENVLSELVEDVREEESENSIVIFVDELDRCRPDHAVLLLERIKHFFDVSGITFVLSMERDQLRYSVKSAYGQEMDAHGYLRRFIDLDFSLPDPSSKEYARLLYEHHDVFGNWRRIVDYSAFVFDLFGLSLRQQKKYFLRYSVVRDVARDRIQMNEIVSFFTSFLIGLRMEKPEVYSGFLNGSEGAKQEIGDISSEYRGESLGSEIEDVKEALEAAVRFWYSESSREVTEDGTLRDSTSDPEGTEIDKYLSRLNRRMAAERFRELESIIELSFGMS